MYLYFTKCSGSWAYDFPCKFFYHKNIYSVLMHLSRVEAAQGGPNAKKRRQALVSENFIAENTVSEEDKGTADSELLNDNTQEGEAPEPSNTS